MWRRHREDGRKIPLGSSLTRWVGAATAAASVGAIAAVTLAPVRLRPQGGHANLERAAAFGLFGATLATSLPRRPLLAAVAIVGGAVALEALQLLTPDRHARAPDALVKAMGGLWGLAAGHGARAMLRWTTSNA